MLLRVRSIPGSLALVLSTYRSSSVVVVGFAAASVRLGRCSVRLAIHAGHRLQYMQHVIPVLGHVFTIPLQYGRVRKALHDSPLPVGTRLSRTARTLRRRCQQCHWQQFELQPPSLTSRSSSPLTPRPGSFTGSLWYYY